MEGALTPHRIVNPETLPSPAGFAHAVVAAPGRTVYLGGQIGEGETIAAQFAAAARNVVTALRAAGAEPEHLVSLTIFVTDVEEYRKALAPIGASYRKHFGKHYPAMALFEVSRLFEQDARVELVAIAVVPA
ncbi:MAG TPA: RidA family protein [Actinomycetota bacterium]|nr:RidA family protein [Actinomycetota bacterium]